MFHHKLKYNNSIEINNSLSMMTRFDDFRSSNRVDKYRTSSKLLCRYFSKDMCNQLKWFLIERMFPLKYSIDKIQIDRL